MMTIGLVARAWADLAYVDLLADLRGFAGIQQIVTSTPVRRPRSKPANVAAVTDAFVKAATLYVRPVPCLRRSAAVTRLLRRHGIPAQLVIGCHLAPLRAHAWVEVGGEIVSDAQAYLEHYCIIDRW